MWPFRRHAKAARKIDPIGGRWRIVDPKTGRSGVYFACTVERAKDVALEDWGLIPRSHPGVARAIEAARIQNGGTLQGLDETIPMVSAADDKMNPRNINRLCIAAGAVLERMVAQPLR